MGLLLLEERGVVFEMHHFGGVYLRLNFQIIQLNNALALGRRNLNRLFCLRLLNGDYFARIEFGVGEEV